MFRSIGGRLEKLKKDLGKMDQENGKLNRAFTRFLDECFPEAKGLIFEVSISNDRVVIRTSNKAVANELILKISELSRILKEEDIRSEQIIIR
jgi:hypothetical protein